MDSDPDDFSFLESSAKRLIANLRAAVGQAKGPEGARGLRLCNYLESILGAIETRLEELREQFSSAGGAQESQAIIESVRFLNIALRGMHEFVPWLEGVNSPLGLGITYFIDEAARTLAKRDVDIIVYGDSVYMYSTQALQQPFDRLMGRIGGKLPQGPPPIVINFPERETRSALMHPLLIHELAHDAVQHHALIDSVFTKYPAMGDLDKKFAAALLSLMEFHAKAGSSISEQEAAVMLRGLLNSWLEELLCDQLALGFLGPTYLLAASAFLLPVSSPQPSRTHPPSAARVSLMLALLQATGWRSYLQRKTPDLLRWLRSLATKKPEVPPPPFIRFATKTIVALAGTMREVALAHLGDNVFKYVSYKKAESQLEGLLDNRILPVQLESGSAADKRSVLTAAWIHRLSQTGATPSSLSLVLEDIEFQMFIDKALEMSAILKEWS